MMLKQDSLPTTTATTVVVCGNCGIEERRLLHHVRHRGIFRRLCTTCVLRLHPQSYCPTCFLVYDRTPPNDTVTCFKCYSSSHSTCVRSPAPSKTPYVCPSCVNPNVPLFTTKKVTVEETLARDRESRRLVDKKAAKVLLAAANIAANSMSKAAVAAKAEAERRAKEAAFTRKRAREALEHVVFLVAKDKKKNHNKVSNATSIGGTTVVGPGMATTGEPVVYNPGGGAEKVDSSNEVLEALNAVELKEKERLGSNSEAITNGVEMEIEDNRKLGTNSGTNNENERTGDTGNIAHAKDTERQIVRNGLSSVPLGDDQPQPTETSHVMAENIDSQE